MSNNLFPLCPLKNPALHIVLDRPRIAGNVAAVVRLAAATASALHVCGPTVFEGRLDRNSLRAGLDYFFGTRIHFHLDIFRCLTLLGRAPWIVEVAGDKNIWEAHFCPGDVVIFGPEDDSVREEICDRYQERMIYLPQTTAVRSLNLAQCVAVVGFEALRQFSITANKK